LPGTTTKESTMHTHHYVTSSLATERIADRHREATRRHLVSRAREQQQPDVRRFTFVSRTRRPAAG
jgi:hypothetical protein